MRFKIAFRNIFRHLHRSLVSIFMIAFGVMAIVLFKGFAHEQVTLLRDSLIRNDTGHMQFANKLFWNNTSVNMADYLFHESEDLSSQLKANSEVTAVSGRINFYGLLSTRDKSVAARAISINPLIEKVSLRSLNYIEGGPLLTQKKMEVIMGAGLAQSLNVHVNDALTILATTVDGVMNAVDVDVIGLYQSSIADIDKTTFIISLQTAQVLLDTEKVEKIIVSIKDTSNTDRVLKEITASLGKFPEMEGRTWYSLSKFYRECEDYYSVYNGVIEAIILTIVLISVLNTVSMSIYERLGEIGTLRALGDSKLKIIQQFILEGLMLGTIGSIMGIGLSVTGAKILNYLRIPIVVPGASVPIPMLIDLMPEIIFTSVLGLIFTTIIASTIPSIQATRIEIVDALKRNI